MITKKKLAAYETDNLLHFGRNMAYGFSALVLSIMLIVSVAGITLYSRASQENEHQLQETITDLLAQSINRISFSGKYHARLLVEQIAASQARIAYITIVNPEGEIIAHSDSEATINYDKGANKQFIQQVLESKKTIFKDFSRHDNLIRQIAMPYRSGYQNKISGVILVGVSMNELRHAEEFTLFALLGLISLLSCAFLVVTLMLSKHYAVPVISHAQQFNRILDSAPLLLCIFNKDGSIKESSSMFTALSPEESEILDSEFNQVMQKNTTIERKIHGVAAGKPSTYQATSFPVLLDRQGSPLLICCIAMDITKHVKTQDELLTLSRAVEASSSSVMITSTDGMIEYVNNKFTEITGYERADVLGKTTHLLQIDNTPDALNYEVWETILAGGEWKGELQNKRADDSLYWSRSSISGVKNSAGVVTNIISIQEDITYEYELTEKLIHQAGHDALTGLINRTEFERRAQRLLNAVKHDEEEHALCFLDLDQFKVVNDTCGHVAGDELLRQLASVLQSEVRHRDTLARLGGDEFGVLMEHCSLEKANRVAQSLLNAVQDFQLIWEGNSFKVGVSIGLVSITRAIPNLTELLKEADAACYMAKDLGRNRIHVYRREDQSLAKRHDEMQWVTRIQQALDEERFRLYAQPIVPLHKGKDIHYELLIRLIDNDNGIIPPGAFLPSAERYNMVSKIDRWVVQKTFAIMARNHAFLDRVSYLSINLSGQSLTNDEMLNFIIEQFDRYEVNGRKICFEITETAAISNLSTANQFISRLKQFGCQFALDDFGSGLSSFGYLKKLSVDYLKIDGMFVRDIVDDPIDRAMVKSINEIGQVMGMKTIAEFVENDMIIGMLKDIGVDYAQGYGIGKPAPLDQVINHTDNIVAPCPPAPPSEFI